MEILNNNNGYSGLTFGDIRKDSNYGILSNNSGTIATRMEDKKITFKDIRKDRCYPTWNKTDQQCDYNFDEDINYNDFYAPDNGISSEEFKQSFLAKKLIGYSHTGRIVNTYNICEPEDWDEEINNEVEKKQSQSQNQQVTKTIPLDAFKLTLVEERTSSNGIKFKTMRYKYDENKYGYVKSQTPLFSVSRRCNMTLIDSDSLDEYIKNTWGKMWLENVYH